MSEILTIHPRPEGGYLVRSRSHDDPVVSVLLLEGAADVSGGLLGEDEATARATVEFLLSHQDPADLPATIEIEDVLAAYPDAADAIRAGRGR